MSRIDLKNATISVLDGFTGTAAVNDSSISGGNTTLGIDTIAGFPNSRTTVPIGARFTIAGVADTIFTTTARTDNEVQQVVVDAASGNFTLTYSGQTTANIAYDASANDVQTALIALSNIGPADVSVTSPTASTWIVEFTGTLANTNVAQMTATDVDLTGGADTVTVTTLNPGGTTNSITFTPALDGGDLPANNDAITFLPIKIEVKIGEGNLTYTETKNYDYFLDRGNLDTVREGDQAPVEVNLEFVYEFVRTGTGETVTPVDALKGIGGAADWTSSSADLCEPYAVDLEIEYVPPCGTSETETTVFPDFRYDTLEFDLSAATIAVTGRSNVTQPTITRS